jgi:hypothetical protein
VAFGADWTSVRQTEGRVNLLPKYAKGDIEIRRSVQAAWRWFTSAERGGSIATFVGAVRGGALIQVVELGFPSGAGTIRTVLRNAFFVLIWTRTEDALEAARAIHTRCASFGFGAARGCHALAACIG